MVAVMGLAALLIGIAWAVVARGSSSGLLTTAGGYSTPKLLGPSMTIDDPVIPVNFPDPFILPAGGAYYAYATNSPTENIPTYWSSDLTTWTAGPDALPTLPRWAIGSGFLRLTWAPSVMRRGSGYILYYAAGDKASDLECISRAEGSSPLGPYTDTSARPLVCQTSLGGDIDPNVFIARGGKTYLLWKSNGNCCGKRTELWSQQLGADGTSLVGRPVPLLVDDQAWQAGIIEGPSMIQEGSLFYLFFSGNAWDTANYAVGYAVCSSPQGPCAEPLDHSLYASKGLTAGPGGARRFTPFHGQLLMSYAAWSRGRVAVDGGARSMRLDPVSFVNGVPRIEGPSAGPVSFPS